MQCLIKITTTSVLVSLNTSTTKESSPTLQDSTKTKHHHTSVSCSSKVCSNSTESILLDAPKESAVLWLIVLAYNSKKTDEFNLSIARSLVFTARQLSFLSFTACTVLTLQVKAVLKVNCQWTLSATESFTVNLQ